MKKQTPIRKTLLLMLMAFVLVTGLKAQPVLIPATAFESIYPAAPPTGDLPSCYSFGNINVSSMTLDGYLSAVNGELIWQLSLPGNPTAMVAQGTVPYPGCTDINVGFNTGTGGAPLVIVAYHLAGTGHFYDVYFWTTGGLILLSSNAISSVPFYTRISMDSHKTYGIVITWEEPTGIYALTGLSGAFTAPVLLTGTAGYERPDVAFSHANVGLNLHFVYDTPNGMPGYDIIESEIDFFVLNSAVGSIAPTVMDINPVMCFWSQMTASIDAPDHYSVDNWAYTYAIDGMDIFVRAMDFNTTFTPVTTNVVNGSLGNQPMWAKELRPRIAYNQNNNTFHVAWYSSFVVVPDGECYFSEQITEDATTLVSSPDYELVASNSAFPPGASLNSITFSKQNDASPYLYTVFLDNMGVHHAFHAWPNTASFKTIKNPVAEAIQHNCSAKSTATGISAHSSPAPQLSVGPNPSSGAFHLFAPASLKSENISVKLTDIRGQLILQYDGEAAGADDAVEKASTNLAEGVYLMSIKNSQSGESQNFKLHKIAGNH